MLGDIPWHLSSIKNTTQFTPTCGSTSKSTMLMGTMLQTTFDSNYGGEMASNELFVFKSALQNDWEFFRVKKCWMSLVVLVILVVCLLCCDVCKDISQLNEFSNTRKMKILKNIENQIPCKFMKWSFCSEFKLFPLVEKNCMEAFLRIWLNCRLKIYLIKL